MDPGVRRPGARPDVGRSARAGCRWNEASVGLTGQPQPAPVKGNPTICCVKATAGSAEQTLDAHLAPARAKCASARALSTEQLGGKDGATVKQSAATRPSDSEAMVKAAGSGERFGQEDT